MENHSEHIASWMFVGAVRLVALSELSLPLCGAFWFVAVFYPSRNLHERLGHKFFTAIRRDEIQPYWILRRTGKRNETAGIAARKSWGR
jgi:hypothetical protein